MKALKIVIMLAAVAVAASTCSYQYKERLPIQGIDDFLKEERIHGAVVAYRWADGMSHVEVFGKARPGTPKPLGITTAFPIASLSKPITSAAIRSLVNQQHLSLEAHLTELLPDLNYSEDDPRYNEITIGHILRHTSGLPGTPNDPLFSDNRLIGCQAAVEKGLSTTLSSRPGAETVYSNIGYCLLGEIIERVTGQEYSVVTQQLLDLPPSITLGPPPGFYWHEGSAVSEEALLAIGPVGGWFSDASALALVYSRDASDQTIAKPLHTELHHYYGLGWRVYPNRDGTYMLTHFGSLPGMFAVAVAYPGGSTAVALFNGRPREDETAFREVLRILRRDLSSGPK